MKYIKINQKGISHKNGECEDAMYISQDKTIFCLADGVSNSKYGGHGAKRIVNICGKKFSDPNAKDLFKYGSVEEIRNAVCDTIDAILSNLCKKVDEKDKEVFASTFLALIKTDENNITLLHAGDGAIFAKPKTEQTYFATVLSYPDNTPDGKVYSVGHPEQRYRMRVLRFRADDYESIMLCTDGFSEAYLVPSFQAYNIDTITKAFEVKSDKELEALVRNEHIGERNITDDISCILCFTDNNIPTGLVQDYDYIPESDCEKNKKQLINCKHEATEDIEPQAVNQIDYNQLHKKAQKNKKTSRLKTPGGILSIIVIFSLLFTAVICIHIKSCNRINKEQATKISLLQEQISSIEEKLSEVEKELNKTDTADFGESNKENDEMTTSDEKQNIEDARGHLASTEDSYEYSAPMG